MRSHLGPGAPSRRGAAAGPGPGAVETVQVGRGAGRYPVLIGPGLLARLARDLAAGRAGRLAKAPARVAIVTDSLVGRLYGRALAASLNRRNIRTDLLVFPRGEARKTRETKAALEDGLAATRFGRDGIILALGGGVAGDLGGFVAATWHRGVGLIQVPTTVIGMLDAAIGGKVGVDHPLAKNLIGAFHPPLAVYADTRTLRTLPDRQFRSGLAEAVKCGVIADGGLFAAIEKDCDALRRRNGAAVLRLVRRAARCKARIVSRDEREAGARMLLNLGHTIGHALESVSRFEMLHGEAVAIGVTLECRLAVRLGLLAPSASARVERLLSDLGLPTSPRSRLGARQIAALLDATSRDKKAREGRVLYVLPSKIGRHAGGSRYAVAVPDRLVEEVLLAGPSS